MDKRHVNDGAASAARRQRASDVDVAAQAAPARPHRVPGIRRTRADADTWEARRNDRGPQTAAFASGAQYVSTDYMHPDKRFSDYETHLPGGGLARLNPVTARP